MKTISEKQARRTVRVGVHRIEPSLYLRVWRGGSKNFIQKLTVGGKRVEIGLGGFPAVSFAEARKQATINRAAVMMGQDPRSNRVVRIEAHKPTFADMERDVFRVKLPTWKGESAAKNWRRFMDRYAMPVIGTVPVDRIGREDLLKILVPIWTDKPSVAKKLRQNIKAVMAAAVSHGHCDINLAGEVLDGALPKQKAVAAHHAALPWQDIPAALDAIEATDSPLAAKAAFRFLILTGCRINEALGATWNEIDGDVWAIPGSRMKTGKEHRVPLSPAALAVIEGMKPLADDSGLIFPSVQGGKMMNQSSIRRVRERAGIEATTHGFRSSFRDWCADTGKPRELAEAALAHVVGGVEGAYFRSDLFDRRRALMSQWAAHCTQTPAKVVPLSAAG